VSIRKEGAFNCASLIFYKGVYGMKICKTCGISKPEEAFYLNKGYREGTCYECKKKKAAAWSKANISPEQRNTYVRNWRKKNPAEAKLRDMRAKSKRRDAIKGTLLDLSTEQWLSTLTYFNNGCAVCGRMSDTHIDHFIPVASGNGDTTVNNVIPLCARHNIGKRDKHPLNWLRQESGASTDAIDKIINYLAKLNGMLPLEYEDYVIDRYYGIDSEFDSDYEECHNDEDISLYDADNFIYDDDDWYLTMLNGRRG
jgi:5-methylcytosine-specific restriction endonuclease McrA